MLIAFAEKCCESCEYQIISLLYFPARISVSSLLHFTSLEQLAIDIPILHPTERYFSSLEVHSFYSTSLSPSRVTTGGHLSTSS